MRALAVLYHDVVPRDQFATSGFSMVGADRYKLTIEQFDAHLAAIAKAIRKPPALVTANGWHESVLLTFDDGGKSAMYIADRLALRQWRAHFFITTNYIDSKGFVSSQDIRELAARGHVIGSHTCSHPMPIWDCPPEQLQKEWSNSRARLEDILGDHVVCASVPGGFYSRAVASAAAAAGNRILFTSEPVRSVSEVDGCRILGRYAVFQRTPARQAAALAGGQTLTCLTQMLLWNGRKIVKKVASRPYAKARRLLLTRQTMPPR